MANGTGKADDTVHSKDTSSVIKPDDVGALDVERRDQYLKRIAKEKREGAKAFVKSDKHIVVEDNKVLLKSKNAAGSEYTQYLFNRGKETNKGHYAAIERVGGLRFTDQESGKEVFWPLKLVNGKEFKRGR